jgi:hypothetical protein
MIDPALIDRANDIIERLFALDPASPISAQSHCRTRQRADMAEREGYARSHATTSSSRSVGLLWIMGGSTSASSSEEYPQSSESI